MLKYMENYINKSFDNKNAESIISKANYELYDLKKNCIEISKNRIKYLTTSIYPAISLYYALQKHMSKEEAFAHMEIMISDNTKKTARKIYEFMGRLPFFFSLFRKMFTAGLKGDSWNVEWVANSKTKFEYNIKKCLWHDTFKQYNCPELCALFCKNDEISFTDVSTKMRFERKGALGYGDDMCDFHFYRIYKNKKLK
ncbi:L-2-amino-thiazoline-4-carboxylic acid hydrolase [Clostridium sp. 'deep sea']|uniref:L-2-amino-thiazoline-4-carboxylic acid hydrolase n=1 Tax=Clostridium sp. 'deep sea' TaxID=2779445 RepID=UPI00189651DA|nr:L-2-amino-thiazoline-4-carboxylic acid hydrolase [Clostridium sp. 'deep sea']QOR35202.1 L-2-amino-thiazoline-4-carboxylic acid hydrolase [Clostridium sp. 'deep sea']